MMLGILQGVFLNNLKEDKIVWNLDKSRCFSTKSYFLNLIDNLDAPLFSPSYPIWKVKVPTKVKMMVWSVAHRKINTNDMVQRRRPNMALFPEWCVVCKNASENVDHLFLHCNAAYFLWSNLYKTFNLSWSASVSCYSLLFESFSYLRGTKKARVL